MSIGLPTYFIPDIYEREEVEEDNRNQLETLSASMRQLAHHKERLKKGIIGVAERLQRNAKLLKTNELETSKKAEAVDRAFDEHRDLYGPPAGWDTATNDGSEKEDPYDKLPIVEAKFANTGANKVVENNDEVSQNLVYFVSYVVSPNIRRGGGSSRCTGINLGTVWRSSPSPSSLPNIKAGVGVSE